MKKIIVPVDFSHASHNAASYAVSLAHYFDAKITLLHVMQPPLMENDSFLAPLMSTHAELRSENINLINHEMELLQKIQPVGMNVLVSEGNATEIIQTLAEKAQADLIVMGMKGKGESQSAFGSTTSRTVRQVTTPVLLVPEEAVFHPIKQIALASDFNPTSEHHQYYLLKELAEKFKSDVTVIHVSVDGRDLTRAQVIGKMKTSLALSQYPAVFHTIDEDSVEEGLEEFLEDNPHDILVMLARQHSFLGRIFGKIHTRTMSYKTKKPLLILHDK